MKINRDWFHNNALFVPQTGLTTTGYWGLFRDLDDTAFSKLNDELDRAVEFGFGQAFMSWEGINTYTSEQIAMLRLRLVKHEVKIYVYLREQSEIIQSGYFQQVKTDQQRYLLSEFHQNKSLLCPDFRNYADMLARFAATFGKNSIHVRVFDRSLLKEGNVVLDMLDMLKLQPDEDFKLSPGEENLSLDLVSVRIMNMLDQNTGAIRWKDGQVEQKTVPVSYWQRLMSLIRPSTKEVVQKQVLSIMNLYFGESIKGREDIVDILLNIIDNEGSIGKYFLNEDDCEIIRDFYSASNKQVVEQFLGLNWPHPALFPYEEPRVNRIELDTIDDALCARLAAIATTGDHRTWNGLVLEGTKLKQIASTDDGWEHIDGAGAKCERSYSFLRFRADWRHINFTHTKLRLVIMGVPSADNTGTRLYLNDQDLGVHHLKRAVIDVPLSTLTPLGLLNIRMEHQLTTGSPSDESLALPRESGFTLTSVKYFRK